MALREIADKWFLGTIPDAWDAARRFLVDRLKNLERILLVVHSSVQDLQTNAVLLTGRTGGQIVPGGNAASQDLTLTSNTTATKDKIYLGSAQTSAFNEMDGRLGINTSSPTHRIHVLTTDDANSIISCQNSNGVGTSAAAVFQAAASTAQLSTIAHGAARVVARYGITLGSWNEILVAAGNGLVIGGTGNVPVVFGTNNAERARIDGSGNVTIGTAALATTATDGFLYIPTCAGAPTGVPTAKTGRVPLVFDTTNNRLYAYDGAWISAAFA